MKASSTFQFKTLPYKLVNLTSTQPPNRPSLNFRNHNSLKQKPHHSTDLIKIPNTHFQTKQLIIKTTLIFPGSRLEMQWQMFMPPGA